MAVVLSSPASILLHSSQSPFLSVPAVSPLSSSAASSSSASSSFDLLRPSSARRIRFAPLPEPHREDDHDLDDDDDDDAQCTDDSHADVQQDTSDTDQSDDLLSSAKHTIIDVHPLASPVVSLPTPQSPPSGQSVSRASKLLRSLPFFRRSISSPHAPPSHAPFPTFHSRDASAPSSPTHTSSSIPETGIRNPPRISTGEILGSLPFFHRSANSPRTRSLSPTFSSASSPLHRTSSVQSCPASEIRTNRNSHDDSRDKVTIRGSRVSSVLSPGAGGGRHSFSTKMISESPPLSRSPTALNSTASPNKANGRRKHVKLLNGRVYGAKRSKAATTNFFATARDEPEFVEWGYGGMGSVRAGGEVGSAVWKGLHSNSGLPTSPSNITAAATPSPGSGHTGTGRRRMTQTVPECGMGNVSVGGGDEDDGSGMGWVKRRREAREREAREKAEREARERGAAVEGEKEPRKSESSSQVASTSTSVTDLSSSGMPEHSHHTTPRGSEEHHVLTTLLSPVHNKKHSGEAPSPIESEQASPSGNPSQQDEDEEDEEEELVSYLDFALTS
ncbi:hypothetical protein J3A83DRAFT_435110 [Scleroderma citrinum]